MPKRKFVGRPQGPGGKAKSPGGKVPVSSRALVQRINRALGKEDQVLRATRGGRARLDLGWYYVVNTRYNVVADKNVDLEALGRELEVLADWEEWEVEE